MGAAHQSNASAGSCGQYDDAAGGPRDCDAASGCFGKGDDLFIEHARADGCSGCGVSPKCRGACSHDCADVGTCGLATCGDDAAECFGQWAGCGRTSD